MPARVQQLADVALRVYEAGGKAIHLPLEPSHPLVAVLRSALGRGERRDTRAERDVGRSVAGALLEGVLAAHDARTSAFPYLLVSAALGVRGQCHAGQREWSHPRTYLQGAVLKLMHNAWHAGRDACG